LFISILHDVREYDKFFVPNHEFCGLACFSSIQKCTASIRVLAYGPPVGSHDNYLHMGEFTTIECMYRLCRVVVEFFLMNYLKGSNEAETVRIMAQNAVKGFPRMVESINCMH
jgi:hypothetical protein